MPEAILFDFDGLILDTEVPIYEAWRENFLAFGHDLPLEVYAACVGSNFGAFDPKSHLESLTCTAIDWTAWDTGRERDALARTHRLDPFPGVLTLLDDADAAGIPCAVASSSPRDWVRRPSRPSRDSSTVLPSTRSPRRRTLAQRRPRICSSPPPPVSGQIPPPPSSLRIR